MDFDCSRAIWSDFIEYRPQTFQRGFDDVLRASGCFRLYLYIFIWMFIVHMFIRPGFRPIFRLTVWMGHVLYNNSSINT